MRLPRVTVVRAVALSMLVVSAADGCASHDGRPDPRPPVAATVAQAPGAAGELGLPLDAYEPTAQEYQMIQLATRRSLRACMKSFGLELDAPDVGPVKYPQNATILSWLGSHEVERYGYAGPPGFADEMAAVAMRGTRPIVIGPELVPIFEGSVREFAGKVVPSGGCDAQTRRALDAGAVPVRNDDLGPDSTPERGIRILAQQAGEQARADARFRPVVKAWSTCMKRAGHRYANPDQAQGDRRWTGTEAAGDGSAAVPVSAAEIATAVADRRCREEVNFSGILRMLVSERESELIRTKGDVVRAVSTLLRTRVSNAAAILRTSPPT
ncbi:hypothetical protein ACWGR4_33705 [Embleya sp. NPDC055664]